MKNEVLSNEEKLRLLMKTKEIYVKLYAKRLLDAKDSVTPCDVPPGLCYCLYQACKINGYSNDDSRFYASNIIPEWNRIITYQVSRLDYPLYRVYSNLNCGYWFPIWDKASRVNFLNWLIDKYTEISSNH